MNLVRSASSPPAEVATSSSSDSWLLTVPPPVLQAACHQERHVSQKAVSFIHDVLTEVLTSWAEPPHFRFNEALFRPFEHIMQLELCDDDVQDQVGGARVGRGRDNKKLP